MIRISPCNSLPARRLRWRYRPLLELLERRVVFASDFGDAPLPYKTLLAEGGAEHVDSGPTLGAVRDTEADGVHSGAASGDDTTGSADEDGVTFGTIRASALGATATVNVQGGSAKLDAWMDFDHDGAWGGAGEQIADTLAMTTGDNVISFDVPSWASNGSTYARFRLSTAGDLGDGGAAADGEVEDYLVTITSPKLACGCFMAKELDDAADGATSVHAADVDGDGDMDVLSASRTDDTIAWYENDGNENFITHLITTTAAGAYSVYATDVDGDGDMDVLSASSNDDTIAWHENDGSENFTTQIISTTADRAFSVYAADLDGDGDTDVLSASVNDDKIAWYENDGSENFTAHTISTAAVRARSVHAADVDGDGDMDVLSASALDDKIAWYENDGSENFTLHTITTTADGAFSVFATDINGDGNLDVVSASDIDKTIAWYENDGSENFTAHAIATDADRAHSVYAADIDGDGDTDVMSASVADNKVAWYENDGGESFTTHLITTNATGAFSVYAADIDGDGDLDVLSGSFADDKINWYENKRTVFGHGVNGGDSPDPDINLPIPPPHSPAPTLTMPAEYVIYVQTTPRPHARFTLKAMPELEWGDSFSCLAVLLD